MGKAETLSPAYYWLLPWPETHWRDSLCRCVQSMWGTSWLITSACSSTHIRVGQRGRHTAEWSHMFLQCVALTFNTFMATNDSFSARRPPEEGESWSALLIFQLKAGNTRRPPRSELWMRIIWMPPFAVGRPRPRRPCAFERVCAKCVHGVQSQQLCVALVLATLEVQHRKTCMHVGRNEEC